MKNLTFLLLVSILFQSCFIYKTVDYNSIPIEKKQEIKKYIRSVNVLLIFIIIVGTFLMLFL